ncbi:phage head-tail joining protein [Yoonia sp. 208BN28-4]|uniref:phage head-tail joining protein n=1 Tax=Yoonia sp. 208BN28-4 TaxID=3126505 RepID=UPI0030B5E040
MSAYSTNDLAELKANYAKGISEISRGDERVKFRSLAEMERVINRVEASLTGTKRTSVRYPTFDKGL